MLCQRCQQRDSTVHFTKILNGEKSEIHLCETCARENGEFMIKPGEDFSFHNLLSGLLGFENGGAFGQIAGMQKPQITRCNTCGLSYQQFAELGRFGCADCYHSFGPRLEPLLRRIHGGATAHTGKVPHRAGGIIKKRLQIESLRSELQQKIQLEQFEEAATLRDRIRELEQQSEAGGN
ncbi:protein arginine kinase activator [Tumebacillus sp. BK434]|uniref:UvrB/UvrC motif-containing protein n=1 Tax=Tumebacillus sp. BK434 TaxID=2512169 RepID=UPI00104F01C3|nr:UvrB/UvrC motif-containing protein [Tumebacillus sp. BK434]TCP52322.1 protein arginine kinase activator [Tumebacillus sp. BK434]